MSKPNHNEETAAEREGFEKGERFRLYKNLVVISFAFMIHFTAFHGTANLQSSINSSQSLGALTLAAIYGSLLLSNILLPVMVIGWLGCKWTIALSFIAYMPFIGAQFFPAIHTLIPAGLLVGLGGGPLWCAKCTYLTVVAEAYAEKTGKAADVLVTKFFGVFFMFYQLAQVWGNMISSTVLSLVDAYDESGTSVTQSFMKEILNKTDEIFNNSTIKDVRDICGANFCGAHEESNPNLHAPSSFKRNLLAGIFLLCMVGAVFSVAFGVDPVKRYVTKRVDKPKESVLKSLMATLRQTADPYQLLLLPATVFIGAEQAFLAAEFNAAFVACAWGIKNIGFVMICFGVFNAIGALATGAAAKITGRYPVMIVALILHLGLIGALLVWRPNPNQYLGFFIIAGVWGLADSIWLIVINSMSGILFPGREEASFSNFRLWESTGSVIVYSYSAYICASYQLYISILLLLLGFIGYVMVEFLEIRAKKGFTINRGFELVNTKEPEKSRELMDLI